MESTSPEIFWTESGIVAEAIEIARVRFVIEYERLKLDEREREIDARERRMREFCRHSVRRVAITPWAGTEYYECERCRSVLGPVPG